MHARGDVAQSVCYKACGQMSLPPHVWAFARRPHASITTHFATYEQLTLAEIFLVFDLKIFYLLIKKVN